MSYACHRGAGKVEGRKCVYTFCMLCVMCEGNAVATGRLEDIIGGQASGDQPFAHPATHPPKPKGRNPPRSSKLSSMYITAASKSLETTAAMGKQRRSVCFQELRLGALDDADCGPRVDRLATTLSSREEHCQIVLWLHLTPQGCLLRREWSVSGGHGKSDVGLCSCHSHMRW